MENKRKKFFIGLKLLLGSYLVYSVWFMRQTLEAKKCMVAVQ